MTTTTTTRDTAHALIQIGGRTHVVDLGAVPARVSFAAHLRGLGFNAARTGHVVAVSCSGCLPHVVDRTLRHRVACPSGIGN